MRLTIWNRASQSGPFAVFATSSARTVLCSHGL
jgi:hypothetical protein